MLYQARDALRLRYLEERSYTEIAEVMSCSPGAARVRVCRALKALRDAMQDGKGGADGTA